jgi:hypothetical protein
MKTDPVANPHILARQSQKNKNMRNATPRKNHQGISLSFAIVILPEFDVVTIL